MTTKSNNIIKIQSIIYRYKKNKKQHAKIAFISQFQNTLLSHRFHVSISISQNIFCKFFKLFLTTHTESPDIHNNSTNSHKSYSPHSSNTTPASYLDHRPHNNYKESPDSIPYPNPYDTPH